MTTYDLYYIGHDGRAKQRTTYATKAEATAAYRKAAISYRLKQLDDSIVEVALYEDDDAEMLHTTAWDEES